MAYQDALLALADPTRRSILQHLRRGPLAVNKIAARLPVSRPAVSQHLRVLEGARLVNVRRDGTRRLYGIEAAGLEELRRYLEGVWDDVLRNFGREAAAVASARRRRRGR
jgi:DNA-binding transcriptional ArsR family regulator